MRVPQTRQQLASDRRPPDSGGAFYQVVDAGHGDVEAEQRPDRDQAPVQLGAGGSASPARRLFFLAQQQKDGTYTIALTEDGIQRLETALGIADDLGGETRISSYSTIADIMDRTATREELSRLLRGNEDSMRVRFRKMVLERQLRGSESPSSWQRTVGHLGKVLIVCVMALWVLHQFAIAVQDIEDIPRILANVPQDIVHLHPMSAFGDVGTKISDAGDHVLFGVLGAILTYLVAKVIQPFRRIYRKDQLILGERFLLRFISRTLRKNHAKAVSVRS